MLQIAGEIYAGLDMDVSKTPYTDEVIVPRVQESAETGSHRYDAMAPSACLFLITCETESERDQMSHTAEQRIGFQSSTRTDHDVPTQHGWEDVDG
jgi:hypothetical protein